MHDIAEFLKGRDPFSGLDEAALERLARKTEVEFFAAGARVYEEGEERRDVVRVVRRGAIELLDDDHVVDLVVEGELLGHPSILSGRPVKLRARAAEDSLTYAIPASEVVPLLGGESGLRSVPRSLLAGRARDEGELRYAEFARRPASALVRGPAVTCTRETSLREAARTMLVRGVSSVLVAGDTGPLGILTDRDLREQVATGKPSPEAPVSEAMTAPVVGVQADQTGAEVLLTMLDHDIDHVPVFSGSSEVFGVIAGADLVAAETREPFHLRRAIARAQTREELHEAAAELRSTVVALHGARLAPAQISEMISIVADALIRRMIELAIASEGPPPAPFAWMSLGSHGRREPMPSSDVDSGMAWRDGREAEGYMHAVAEEVAECVKVVGWQLDPHGVTAAGSFAASSIEEWREAIGRWLSHPDDNRVLIATSILLDGRVIYGEDRELDVKPLLFEAGDRSGLLGWMLRLALASRPPTGFLRDIVVEHTGEHRGTFDIKHGGLMPIVDLARYAALRAGAETTSTVERLHIGEADGTFDQGQAAVLEEALELFSALRLDHQVRQIEAGAEPDDHLDPAELSHLTRRYLRDAFREVAAVQRMAGTELASRS